jgi:predicted RNA-binding Zn-ribbon protein involved in translation (DUF1610 family)
MDSILGLGVGVYVAIGIVYFFATAIFTSWLASVKGYSSGVWFILGLFFSLVALLALGFSPNKINNNSNKNISEHDDNVKWKCPKCDNYNPNNTFSCEKCGYSLK